MKTKRLHYAMIGGAATSFIGPIHRMALRLDDLADLTAASFSRNRKTCLATASALRLDTAHAYTDWQLLLEKEAANLDFVTVCTTNESHYAISRAALLAGLDVFCEKPLSLTVAEAEDLARIARRKKRILGIPFTYTGYPMVKLARDLVKRGDLGKIDKVDLEYVQGSFRKIDFSKPLDKRNSWKMNPAISGPSCVVADIGVHAFTMLEYVTGLEAKTLLADLSSFAPGNRLDDDASILVRMTEGAKASLVVSKVATGEENGVRLRVYGDKASLYWDQESPNYLHVKSPFAPEQILKRNAPYVEGLSSAARRSSRFPAGHHEGFVEALANIYDQFVSAVISRKDADFPGTREGIRSMRFVEAALKSAKCKNSWVKV